MRLTVNASCAWEVKSLYLALSVTSSFQQYGWPDDSSLAYESIANEEQVQDFKRSHATEFRTVILNSRKYYENLVLVGSPKGAPSMYNVHSANSSAFLLPSVVSLPADFFQKLRYKS